jgi:sulfofructose kinase
MSRVLCVGHAVQDYVFRLPQLPDRGAKYRATDFMTVGGGPAATAAVAIARLGGSALLAARVGDDPIAAAIELELTGFGVDCRHLRRLSGCSSSLSAVFVDAAGERMIVNHIDPRLPKAADWLADIALDGVDAVLADSRWPEGAMAMLARAKHAGLTAVLDADIPVPKDEDLLQSATHAAFSAPGLADYSGDDDPERALRQVAARTGIWCCVTLGAEGVLYTDGGALARAPAFRVDVVDTLGAGDVWHGAFALALAEGSDEPTAIRLACAAAALKVRRRGGRTGAPTRAERDQFLETR